MIRCYLSDSTELVYWRSADYQQPDLLTKEDLVGEVSLASSKHILTFTHDICNSRGTTGHIASRTADHVSFCTTSTWRVGNFPNPGIKAYPRKWPSRAKTILCQYDRTVQGDMLQIPPNRCARERKQGRALFRAPRSLTERRKRNLHWRVSSFRPCSPPKLVLSQLRHCSHVQAL